MRMTGPGFGVLVLVALAGCVFEEVLSEDAQITCAGAADCPTGYVCKSALQRCLPEDGLDDVPPEVSSGTVTALARVGEVITATFEVSEPLAGVPTVELAQGAELALVERRADGRRFVFARTLDGGEGQGDQAVIADLVDESGNLARGQGVGTTRLDFLPPHVLPGSAAVQLAAPSSLLDDVHAAGVGTTIRLSFIVDEPLREAPHVSFQGSDATFVEAVAAVGTAYVFEHIVDASDVEGPQLLSAQLVDLAGNETEEALLLPAHVIVDLSPPALDPDTLEYRRVPWGADDSGGAKHFTISTLAPLPPSTTLVVWDGADLATAGEIGRGRTDAAGLLNPIELNAVDRADVFVSLVDDAGNIDSGAPAPVRHVSWVATLGGKVAGSTFPNPHRLDVVPRAPHVLSPDDATEVDGESIALSDAQGLTVPRSARWLRADAPDSLSTPPTILAMAANTQQGGAMLIGSADHAFSWQDGWTRVEPTDSLLTGASAIAFDARRARFIVATSSILSEGFLLEREGTGWREVAVPLASASLAWDPVSQAVMIVGGAARFFLWDGTTLETRTAGVALSTPGTNPVLATDPVRHQVLAARPGATAMELVSWDGQTWREVDTVGAPPRRDEFAFAFDPDGDRLVLLGGVEQGVRLADAWALDPDALTWSALPTLPAGVSGGAAAAFDGRRLVVVGGGGPPGTRTVVLEGGRWREAARDDRPPAVFVDGGLAYSPSNEVTLLDDGAGQTWQWGGWSWSPLSTSTTPPTGASALVYHGQRDALCSVQGVDVFCFDGSDWSSVSSAGPGLVPAAAAYDAARNEVVVFGAGADRNETWVWDGNGAWSTRSPAHSPPPRVGHGVAYDAVRERVVLFGGAFGEPELDDTWVWDGTDWTDVTDAVRPPGRIRHAMSWDPLLERVILFGGGDDLGVGIVALADNDVWAFGDGWERLDAAQRPAFRYAEGMAFDDVAGATTMFGGFAFDVFPGVSGAPSAETWRLEAGGGDTPAVLVRFDLSFLGPSAASLTDAAVEVRVRAGADSLSGPGVSVAVWDAGAWREIGSTSATGAAPEELLVPVDGALGRLLGGDAVLHLRIAARGARGAGAGIAIDSVELGVRYTAP